MLTIIALFSQFVIVVDDENEDVEGNLITAASYVNPEQMGFMVKNGSGIVSVGMKEEDLESLKLPLMSPETEDEDSSAPTFTITVVRIARLLYCYLKIVSIVHSICSVNFIRCLGCKNRHINRSFCFR